MCVFVHADKTDTVLIENARQELSRHDEKYEGKKMPKVRLTVTNILILFVMYAAGCTQAPTRVSSEVDVCCEADFFRYKTYQVDLTDAPGFLEPYLRQGLASVLAQKGHELTLDKPDLIVNLILNQLDLTPEASEQDSMGESLDPAGSSRFMAAVSVAVIDTSSERIVWSGRLSRIHHQSHGQPRGNDHKMQGIIDGFAVLFSDYPVRIVDTVDQP
jgi:hypothetical protein